VTEEVYEGPHMAYTDFTLDTVEPALSLTIRRGELFAALEPLPVPGWVVELLDRGKRGAALVSEKARSEFMVVPLLLAAQELIPEESTIFSGQRLDVDPARGLVGECDFILALTPAIPRLKAPLVTILAAKKGDIEAGLGQCIAQSVAARLFNERAGEPEGVVFGCVTTGDDWQFFRIDGTEVTLDRKRLYMVDPGDILAMLQEILRLGIELKREQA
jgi:hypothetical protein